MTPKATIAPQTTGISRHNGPRLRVLIAELTALGPGRATLLEHIGHAGSISAAARAMGMSYRRAWLLVEATNAAFVSPVVMTSTGGSGGGGAQLTPFGHEILARYRALEQKAAILLADDFAEFSRFLALPATSGTVPDETEADAPGGAGH